MWSSNRTYVLASVAGIVGLGNLWRFPYMVGENGGGTFVVAYLICVVLIGVPLAVIEVAAGKHFRRGPVGAFRSISPVWGPWFGWFLVGMTILIMSYYFVITGWTLGYAINAFRGVFQDFSTFTQGFNSLWLFAVVVVVVIFGLKVGMAGVEKTSLFLLPMLVLIVGGLAIYAQTIEGSEAGRDFYFSFDIDSFASLQIWRMAAGQAFYSLSIGLGFLITYGSYAPERLNIIGSTLAIATTNSAISLIAGLMVFPIIFAFGIPADTGSELSFTAFPSLLGELAAGRLIGIGLFSLLFLAAFTSCYGGMMIPMTAFRFEFGISRTKAALIAMGLTSAVGIPSALSFTSAEVTIASRPFLEQIDYLTGSGIVLVAGIAGTSLLAWNVPRERLFNAFESNAKWPATVAVLIARWLPIAAIAIYLVSLL